MTTMQEQEDDDNSDDEDSDFDKKLNDTINDTQDNLDDAESPGMAPPRRSGREHKPSRTMTHDEDLTQQQDKHAHK